MNKASRLFAGFAVLACLFLVVGTAATSSVGSFAGGTRAGTRPGESNRGLLQPGPKVLLFLSASGDAITPEFRTTGEWVLHWAYTCGLYGYPGNFIVGVYQGGRLDVADDTGPNQVGWRGTGNNYFYGGGELYLQVTSECGWTVQVDPVTDVLAATQRT